MKELCGPFRPPQSPPKNFAVLSDDAQWTGLVKAYLKPGHWFVKAYPARTVIVAEAIYPVDGDLPYKRWITTDRELASRQGD